MAIFMRASVNFTCTMTLNETEMSALDALVGYGDDAFLKAFGEKLGTAYMRDHTAGLRSLFKTIRNEVLPALSEVQRAKRDLMDAAKGRAANPLPFQGSEPQ